MKSLRSVILPVGLLVVSLANLNAANTRATLMLDAESARPGDTVMAGVRLDMNEGWHTYWRFGGDSGAPTKIAWTLPAGVSAGAIRWPTPERFEEAGFVTYVYHDQAVLLVPLKISEEIEPGRYPIKAQVEWLECEKVCIPGKDSVEASLTVSNVAKPSEHAALIEEWKQKIPQPDPSLDARAVWDGPAQDDSRNVIIEFEKKADAETYDFFPYGAADYEVSAKTSRLPVTDDTVRLRKEVLKWEGDWPERIQGLIVESAANGNTQRAVEVDLPVKVLTADAKKSTSVGTSTPSTGQGATGNLLLMLLFAFLGGMILNIMPCVLPVISLKILSFVRQSKESPAFVRRMGIVYSLGVLVSFLALAGVVIGVKAAGHLAGWGMQFGNPYFLVFMIVLVTLVALNLFGLFEITLTGGVIQAAGTASSREGAAGAFFSGVLATALATPCTAPFLGAAVGFAVRQPAPVIVLLFLVMGLGLALPYVLLSWHPAWLSFLPKPGPWMEKFKIAMGFPMLATAVWLSTLLVRHYGQSGVLWVGIFLVILAMAGWIWGTFVQHGRRRKGLSASICLVLIIAGYWYTLEEQLRWRTPRQETGLAGMLSNKPGGIPWRAWSPEAVAQVRAEGHPVLVDFTADWCLTCQVNEETSLETPRTIQKLREINAVAFKADYTLIPTEITEELQKYDRAGVPLVLIFPADPGAEPFVLPEILTPSLVLEKLEAAANMKRITLAQP